jgi:polyphosphate kinase
MSLIEFERRVLDEARDPRNPVLERVKFLGILGRNLDEFVMVRGRDWLATPDARRLTRLTHALLRDGQRVFRRQLVPALAQAGIHVADYRSLAAHERAQADDYFFEAVLPFMTPIRCDAPVGDAPNLGLNFIVALRDDYERVSPRPHGGEGGRLAIVRVPDQLSSLVALTRGKFIWLEQIVLGNLQHLFPGATIEAAHLFRILRDADIVLEPADMTELPSRTLEAVRQRHTNPIMMLVVERAAEPLLVDRLAKLLGVHADAVVRTKEVLDLKRLWDFSRLEFPQLRFPVLEPQVPPRTATGSLFTAIRRGDILLHHPFESFQPVVDLLREAAGDPDVESISATIYRTDRGESPVVDALVAAAQRGKQVRVVVELKARFDERRNAEWAFELRAAGAQVIHAPAGLKVHAKTLLIVRREDDRLMRYAHVSTGNYSSFTSMVYTDFGLMTCNETITSDVAELFDIIAGDRQPRPLRALLAAPFALRTAFKALVEREIAWAARGEAAHIVLKMNALVDQAAVDLLQRASQAGVQVDLIVRGVCCLRPGVAGTSDRIRVRSIVGRFLEHSRAWYFRNGGDEEVYIGSADLMPRNFDRRVEIVVPVKDRALAHRLRYEILDLYLADTLSARELRNNGRYVRVQPQPGDAGVSCQTVFLGLPTVARSHDALQHAFARVGAAV